MLPASPPAAAPPPETLWVESELVRTLMRTSQQVQFAAWLVIPVYLVLVARREALPALAAWIIGAALIALVRGLALRHYARALVAAEPLAQLAFFERVQWLWPLSAVMWGLAPALFGERTPLAYEFSGWLVLAVTAMMAVHSLASHLRTVRRYIHALMGTALAVVLWRLRTQSNLDEQLFSPWLVLMLLLYWLVLLQAARRLHLTHRRNFELQYRNTQLINSLTRQTQAALNAVEIKKRFLASATHDIRQPVHALQLYADWLASEPDLAGEIAPKIVESTRAVNTLFDSLFDLVRLDAGHIRVQVEEVCLDMLLDDLELQYRPLAEAKGLRLLVRRAGGRTQSDPLLLRRVAGNLVSNAIKYTERGGVLVAVRHGASGPRLEVWDTGVGIAPAHHEEIFREFYKVPLHAGTEDGFGLGLYIVGRLTHILGHPVSLASRPGRGTVFRLALAPTDAAQALARAASIDQLPKSP
jgi:signal transduction histidine kinase